MRNLHWARIPSTSYQLRRLSLMWFCPLVPLQK